MQDRTSTAMFIGIAFTVVLGLFFGFGAFLLGFGAFIFGVSAYVPINK